VYGAVHLYLAESKGDGRREWLDALDTVKIRFRTGVNSS